MLKRGAQKVSVIQPMRPRVLWVLLSGFMERVGQRCLQEGS